MSDRTTCRDAAKLTAGAWSQSLLAYANQIGFERCVAAICDVDETNLSASDSLEVM
jgi:hypothetical protein